MIQIDSQKLGIYKKKRSLTLAEGKAAVNCFSRNFKIWFMAYTVVLQQAGHYGLWNETLLKQTLSTICELNNYCGRNYFVFGQNGPLSSCSQNAFPWHWWNVH